MPCNANTILAAGRANFGGLGRIKLLQLSAQNAANWLHAVDPSADVSVDAILHRACIAGVGCQLNKVKILQEIAENLCRIRNSG